MTNAPSVALMIGFHLLAAAVTAGLLYIPYAEYAYLHRLDIRIVPPFYATGSAFGGA